MNSPVFFRLGLKIIIYPKPLHITDLELGTQFNSLYKSENYREIVSHSKFQKLRHRLFFEKLIQTLF